MNNGSEKEMSQAAASKREGPHSLTVGHAVAKAVQLAENALEEGDDESAVALLEPVRNWAQGEGQQVIELACCHNLGTAYTRLKSREKAVEMHARHLELARLSGEAQAVVRACGSLGRAHQSFGEYSRAAEVYEEQLRIVRETDDRSAEWAAGFSLGMTLRALGNHKRAITVWEGLLQLAREAHNQEAEAEVLIKLGHEFTALGQHAKAVAMLEACLKIEKRLGVETRQTYGNLGLALLSLGENRTAAAMCERCLELVCKTAERRDEGIACGNLGIAYASLGRYGEAMAMHRRHLLLAQEAGDRLEEAKALGNLGNSLQNVGELWKAIGCHEKQLELAVAAGDRAAEGRACGSLGNAYAALSAIPTAIRMYERRLAIATELGDTQGEREAYSSLGPVVSDLGEPRRAVELLQKAIAMAQESGDREGEAAACGNLGNVHSALGDSKSAIELHERALQLSLETGNKAAIARGHANLGREYLSVAEPRRAIDMLEQALDIAKDIGNSPGVKGTYSLLGTVYGTMKEYERAIEMHKKSLKMQEEMGMRWGGGYGNLGVSYHAIKQHRTAVELHRKHWQLAQEAEDVKELGISLENLSEAYEALGEADAALRTAWEALGWMQRFERNIGGGHDSLRLCLFETQQTCYQLMQRLFRSMGREELAFAVVDGSKARGLVYLVDGESVFADHADGQDQAVSSMENEWSKLAGMARALACTVVQYAFVAVDQLVVWVVSSDGELQCATELDIGANGHELGSLLSVVEAALQSAGGRGEESGASVAESTPTFLELINWVRSLGDQVSGEAWKTLSELKGSTETWKGLLTRGSGQDCCDDDVAALRMARQVPDLVMSELHRRLVAPIAPTLQGAERVLVVPQRELFRVPWAALRDEEGVFMIQRHVLSVAPSLRVADAARRRRAMRDGQPDAPACAVVVGNPWPLSHPLRNLSYAVVEADAVARHLRSRFEVRVLKEGAATVQAVTECVQGAGWVHLACHAQVCTAKGERGEDVSQQLLLACCEGDKGELAPAAVQCFQLAAGATVVLSCCQSGLGEMTGEGVIGLSRSFLAAGAGALLVAVCPINDQSTAKLMLRLYQLHGLGPSGLDLPSALREAVLELAGLKMLRLCERTPFDETSDVDEANFREDLDTSRGAGGMPRVTTPCQAPSPNLDWRAWGGFLAVC